MKSLSPSVSLLSLVGGASVVLAASLQDVPLTSTFTKVNKFIVEIDLNAVPSFAPETIHDHLYRGLASSSVDFKVEKEYNSDSLFVGAAVTLSDPKDLAKIQTISGVTAVRPVQRIPPPIPINLNIVTSPSDKNVPPDNQSTHRMTGVDKLHSQGITGKGIKIGIIDTGIDYNHPALGGGIGPGKKVVGGYDFVGDAYNGTSVGVKLAPKDDPMDCDGHGTHVAGIIAASPGNEFGISGVAYDASISSYKIFGCEGGTDDSVIIDGLIKAYADGMDIITLSIGGPGGWSESTASVVANRIVEKGKIVTIAAGNDGDIGSWYASNPASGPDILSIASIDNILLTLQSATVSGVQHDPIPYYMIFPLAITDTLPVYATSTDIKTADDACKPLPASTPDLSKFIVLIRRGGCPFTDKLKNAADKGAKFMLVYNNVDGFFSAEFGNYKDKAALILAADGEFLVKQLAANVTVSLTFPQTGGETVSPDAHGGLVSDFSTYGPSYDFLFQPSLAAPGGNIVSTYPLKKGKYATESGTSMATPFIAGVSALLLSTKGNNADVAKSAKALFQTTAQRVPSSKDDGAPLQTLTQQGAGLVDAYKALTTTTVVSPGQFILNDTANFQSHQEFTVQNLGKNAQTYDITHIPAGTAATIQAGSIFASQGPLSLTTEFASVAFSQTKLTIGPGEKQTVKVDFTAPHIADPSTYPIFSGFIGISSDTVSTQVSYIGLAASLKDKQVMDNTDTFFKGTKLPAIISKDKVPITQATNFTFVGDDFPTLLFRLAFATPIFRVDLVAPDSNVKSNLRRREAEPAPLLSVPSEHDGGSFAGVGTFGTLAEFDYLPRSSFKEKAEDNGFSVIPIPKPAYANGTTIAKGSYRVLVRALRVTGDSRKEEDYETWLSEIIGFV